MSCVQEAFDQIILIHIHYSVSNNNIHGFILRDCLLIPWEYILFAWHRELSWSGSVTVSEFFAWEISFLSPLKPQMTFFEKFDWVSENKNGNTEMNIKEEHEFWIFISILSFFTHSIRGQWKKIEI